MSEVDPGRVTILENQNLWSVDCLERLEAAGLIATRLDPELEFLREDEVKGNLYIVRVKDDQSERFALVERVGNYGGMSLVMAEGKQNYIPLKCMTLRRVAYIGHQSEVNRIVEVANAVFSPTFKGRYPV